MRKLFGFTAIVSLLCLQWGCTIWTRSTYQLYTHGLPATQQWKCRPAFGDVNEDGLLDLAAIARKGNGAHVWINRGDGGWTDSSEGLLLPGSCGGGVDFGDFNHDGHMDLAVGDHCHGLYLYEGDGTGIWRAAPQGHLPFQADDVVLGDFDGDRNLDLAACSARNQGIRIFAGDGKGGWRPKETPGLPSSDGCRQIVPADFNNDGILDLAATMTEEPGVWLATPQGNWVASSVGLPRLSWGGQYWGAATGDVNADGRTDLVLARTVQGPEVYLNDGRGGWQPALKGLSRIRSAWGIALGDVDGDGHPDLVVSGMKNPEKFGNGYGVFLFQGDGEGNWRHDASSGLPGNGLPKAWGLSVADMDGDGCLEIGGGFGEGSYQLPPFLRERTPPENPLPSGTVGPQGSILVWKVHGCR